MFTNVILISLIAVTAYGDLAVPGLSARNVLMFKHSKKLLSRQELTPIACSDQGLQACVLYYSCCTPQEYCNGVGCCPLGQTCTGPVVTDTQIISTNIQIIATNTQITLDGDRTSTSFLTQTIAVTSTETFTNIGVSTSSSTSTSESPVAPTRPTPPPRPTAPTAPTAPTVVPPSPPPAPTPQSATTETVVTTPSSSLVPIVSSPITTPSSSLVPIVSPPTTTPSVALPPTPVPTVTATSPTVPAPLSTGPGTSIIPFTGAAAGRYNAPLPTVFACLGLYALVF